MFYFKHKKKFSAKVYSRLTIIFVGETANNLCDCVNLLGHWARSICGVLSCVEMAPHAQLQKAEKAKVGKLIFFGN